MVYSLLLNKRFKVNSFHPEEYANIFPDVFFFKEACFSYVFGCLIDFYSCFLIHCILRVQITPFDVG